MRAIVMTLLMLALSASAQNLFVYSKDGKTILCAPRDIPANAVTLSGKQPVLGMHSATPAVKASCGWYRVVPSAATPGKNQYVAARTYAISGNTAIETVVISNRVKRTARQRIDKIFAELEDEAGEDAKIKAVLAQMAEAITNRLDKGNGK